jgi:hypothetical protein
MKRGPVRTHWWNSFSASRSLVFTLLILVTGCGSQSSADNIREGLKAVRSWAATAHLLGDTWMAGSAPTPYATQTLLAAQQRLQEARARLQSQSIPADARGALLGQLQNLEKTVGQMRAVIQQGDHSALAQQIGQLSAEEKTIASLAKGD